MWFMDWIIQQLASARDWFYRLYVLAPDILYVGWWIKTPAYYLYLAFHYLTLYFGYFNDWLDYVNAKVGEVLSLQQITSYFSTWITYATNAWNWVYYAWNNVTNIINSWWSTTQYTVLAWIDDAKYWLQAQIDNLELLIADLRALWNEIADKIPSLTEVIAWFADWWANILSPLNSWWTERLLDVSALIRSELRDWFPFYDDLVNLWSSITEFFTDPEEWLYKAVDRIFERFW